MLSDIELPSPNPDEPDLVTYLAGLDRLTEVVRRAKVPIPGHGARRHRPQPRVSNEEGQTRRSDGESKGPRWDSKSGEASRRKHLIHPALDPGCVHRSPHRQRVEENRSRHVVDQGRDLQPSGQFLPP